MSDETGDWKSRYQWALRKVTQLEGRIKELDIFSNRYRQDRNEQLEGTQEALERVCESFEKLAMSRQVWKECATVLQSDYNELLQRETLAKQLNDAYDLIARLRDDVKRLNLRCLELEAEDNNLDWKQRRPEVVLDRAVVDEMLGFANTGITLCHNILNNTASAKLVVLYDFNKWFLYMQEQLGPALFGDEWKGPKP